MPVAWFCILLWIIMLQECTIHRYSSSSSSSSSWAISSKNLAPLFQIGSGWNLAGLYLRKKSASIDGVGFSIWRRTFQKAAVTAFHAEKCCHPASAITMNGSRSWQQRSTRIYHFIVYYACRADPQRWVLSTAAECTWTEIDSRDPSLAGL